VSTAGYVPLNTRPYGGHERLLALVGSPQRVLDIGCSSGYLAGPLAERGAHVIGIELDEDAAAEARGVCEEVLVGDVESMELPFPEHSFDVVLCGDVIEHLRDAERFLDRVRPLLRPGGRLALTTPNVANWAMRLGATASAGSSTERTRTCSRRRPWRRCWNGRVTASSSSTSRLPSRVSARRQSSAQPAQ
jgi:SAM-dependent methyltransferase